MQRTFTINFTIIKAG